MARRGDGERLEAIVSVRFTPGELEDLRRAASAAGVTLSVLIRGAVLGSEAPLAVPLATGGAVNAGTVTLMGSYSPTEGGQFEVSGAPRESNSSYLSPYLPPRLGA
jgi:hypothetical protein